MLNLQSLIFTGIVEPHYFSPPLTPQPPLSILIVVCWGFLGELWPHSSKEREPLLLQFQSGLPAIRVAKQGLLACVYFYFSYQSLQYPYHTTESLSGVSHKTSPRSKISLKVTTTGCIL